VAKLQRIELRPDFDASRIPNQSAATVVNMYAEKQDGKGPFPLVNLPPRIERLSGMGALRGSITPPQGGCYVVAGASFLKVEADWSTTLIGAVPGLDLVEIVYNRVQLGLVADGRWFVYDFATTTYAEVTTTQGGFVFPGARSATVVENIGVIAAFDDRTYNTDIDDFRTIRDLAFQTAESKADPVIVTRTIGGELFLGGTASIEFWVRTGEANFPYQRRNVVSDYGVVSRDACRNVGTTVMFLGTDAGSGGLRVYQVQGYAVVPISTHAVERMLERARFPERARAVSWNIEGHGFFELTCDAGSVTYDEATGAWTQTAFGTWDYDGRAPPTSRLTTQSWFQNRNMLGTIDGKLLEVSWAGVDDGGDVLARCFITPALGSNGRQMAIFRVGLELEGGLGSLTADPQVWMRYSGDGAHTWGPMQLRGTGLQGKYRTSVTWGPQGQAADACIMFGMTDRAPFKVTGAWAEVEVRDVR
jgi:hypothetical protein